MPFEKVIPKMELPKDSEDACFEDERLVSVEEYFGGKVLVEPVYYKQGLKGAGNFCLVRVGVAERLQKALESLPEGYTFKVYDAWRSIELQQTLFDAYYNTVKAENSHLSHEELVERTKRYVSVPSYDQKAPSVHNTGGAIDLTLVDTKTGEELDMGTEFDDFSVKANTVFFEDKEDCIQKKNRRILYWSMINAGFTNLPTEWWHFDYGTKFWSFYTKKPAKYSGIKEVKYEKE